MPVPIVYRKSTEAALASYNFTDIAEGTGVVTYYGATTNDSVGEEYVLLSQTLYSYSLSTATTITNGTGSYTKFGDYDFDLSTFSLPKTIKGTCLISFGWGLGAGGNPDAYIIWKVRKYDGTTETDLGSVQTEGIKANATNAEELLSFTLTETNFAKGDILRVTCEVWGKNTGGVDYVATFAHSPKAQSVNTGGGNLTNSVLTILIPYKLDL